MNQFDRLSTLLETDPQELSRDDVIRRIGVYIYNMGEKLRQLESAYEIVVDRYQGGPVNLSHLRAINDDINLHSSDLDFILDERENL